MNLIQGCRVFCPLGIAGPGMVVELQSSRWLMSERSHLEGTEEVVLRDSDSSRFISFHLINSDYKNINPGGYDHCYSEL